MPLTVLAAALTFGTGAMDVASVTRLGGVFSSVMTGNLVLLGLAAARTSNAAAALSVTRRGPATAPTEAELTQFLADA